MKKSIKEWNQSTLLIVILAIIVFACVMYSFFFKSAAPSSEPSLQNNDIVESSSPAPKDSSSGADQEQLQRLKADTLKFLEVYFTIPNGTKGSYEEKQSLLASKFTEAAREEYMDDTFTPSAEQREIIVLSKTEFEDVNFFVSPNYSSTDCTVFIDCIKSLKTSEMPRAAKTNFQFSAAFKYDEQTQHWLCDKIIKSEDVVSAVEDTKAGD